MRKSLFLLTSISVLAASPVFAFGDSNSSVNANNGSVAVGHSNNGVINNNSGGAVNEGGIITNDNTSKSYSNSDQHQSQYQGQSANSSVKNSGNSENQNSVSVAAQKRDPVSTAYSASLVAADDTCAGSSSAGIQAVGFGISGGSTWQDEDCVRRKDARELRNMGYKGASIALMCQNENIRSAMAVAENVCPASATRAETADTVFNDVSTSDRPKH